MLLIMTIGTVSASNDSIVMSDSFGAKSVSSHDNKFVTIPIEIDNVKNGPIQTITFDLDYSDTVFKLNSIITSNEYKNWNVNIGQDENNIVLYTSDQEYSIQNDTSNTIADIEFEVIGQQRDVAHIEFNNLEYSNIFIDSGHSKNIQHIDVLINFNDPDKPNKPVDEEPENEDGGNGGSIIPENPLKDTDGVGIDNSDGVSEYQNNDDLSVSNKDDQINNKNDNNISSDNGTTLQQILTKAETYIMIAFAILFLLGSLVFVRKR